MKFDAFISYSHGQDAHLAPGLERALQKFAKPTFKRRALNIFRDSNDLSVSPDLWGKIAEGLNDTNYFIFFASPASANSLYCKKEVEHWLQHKSIDHFLVALTDGELVWDHANNDFDWEKTTALPDILSGAFANEPLFVDLREVSKSDNLTLENSDFRDIVVQFAATIHGKSVGDMVGEDMKQHKRTMRIRNAAIGVLSTLLIAAILLSIYAVYQKNIAVEEADKALLVSYIANSKGQFNNDPTKALRLAEQAYTFAKRKGLPEQEAAEQLIRVFYSGSGFYQHTATDSISFDDEDVLESGSWQLSIAGKYESWDASNRFSDNVTYYCSKRFYEVSKEDKNNILYTYNFDNPLCNFRYAEDGPFMLGEDLDGIGHDISVFPRMKMQPIVTAKGHQELGEPHVAIRYNKQLKKGIILAAGSGMDFPELHAIRLSRPDQDPAILKLDGFGSANDGITDLEISANGRYAAIGSVNGSIALIDSEAFHFDRNARRDQFKVRGILKNAEGTIIKKMRFSQDDSYLFSLDASDQVKKWKTEPFPYIEFPRPQEGLNRYAIIAPEYNENLVRHFTIEEVDEVEHLLNSKQQLIAKFPTPLNHYDENKKAGLNFKADLTGIYNRNGELLVKLNLWSDDNSNVSLWPSPDQKFLLVRYHIGLMRIFALDPEFIIERINNTDIMGNIAHLSEADKARFLVQ